MLPERHTMNDTDTTQTDTTLTFDESAAETVIEAFGWATNERGEIVDEETGGRVLNRDFNPVRIGEFAGVISGSESGNPIPITSDFTELVEVARRRRGDSDE